MALLAPGQDTNPHANVAVRTNQRAETSCHRVGGSNLQRQPNRPSHPADVIPPEVFELSLAGSARIRRRPSSAAVFAASVSRFVRRLRRVSSHPEIVRHLRAGVLGRRVARRSGFSQHSRSPLRVHCRSGDALLKQHGPCTKLERNDDGSPSEN